MIGHRAGYEVSQPSKTSDGRKLKTKLPMWGLSDTPPTAQELTYLRDAALRRHLSPQPGSSTEFGHRLVISRTRAIMLGSLPVIYFRRTVDDINLLRAVDE